MDKIFTIQLRFVFIGDSNKCQKEVDLMATDILRGIGTEVNSGSDGPPETVSKLRTEKESYRTCRSHNLRAVLVP